MVLVVMLSLVACGKKSVEGTWLNDDDMGYRFDKLGKTDDGEKLGSVTVLDDDDGFTILPTAYYYRYMDKNTIEIICYSAAFTNDGIGTKETQHDVLHIEKEGGATVLVSEETGDTYYLQKNS